jgi:hypothetical protein
LLSPWCERVCGRVRVRVWWVLKNAALKFRVLMRTRTSFPRSHFCGFGVKTQPASLCDLLHFTERLCLLKRVAVFRAHKLFPSTQPTPNHTPQSSMFATGSGVRPYPLAMLRSVYAASSDTGDDWASIEGGDLAFDPVMEDELADLKKDGDAVLSGRPKGNAQQSGKQPSNTQPMLRRENRGKNKVLPSVPVVTLAKFVQLSPPSFSLFLCVCVCVCLSVCL